MWCFGLAGLFSNHVRSDHTGSSIYINNRAAHYQIEQPNCLCSCPFDLAVLSPPSGKNFGVRIPDCPESCGYPLGELWLSGPVSEQRVGLFFWAVFKLCFTFGVAKVFFWCWKRDWPRCSVIPATTKTSLIRSGVRSIDVLWGRVCQHWNSKLPVLCAAAPLMQKRFL